MGEMTLEQVRDWHLSQIESIRKDRFNHGATLLGIPDKHQSCADAIDAHLAQAGEVVAWMMTAPRYGRPPEFFAEKPSFVPPISTLTPLYATLSHPRPAVPEAWIKAFRDDVAHWPNHYLSQRLERLLDLLSAAPESGGG